MKTIVSTFKQLALFAGLMIFCFSLTVCGERQVDIRHLPSGLYLLKVTDPQGHEFSTRMLKR